MDKRFLIILIVLVLGFFGFLVLRPDSDENDVVAEPTNHIRGTGDLLLVEYGDFQCPACYSYEATLQQVATKYEGKLRMQFRHFPLSSIHQHAVAASRAAEAAGNQGKFWEMHDKLYGQSDWISWSQSGDSNVAPTFRGYAQQLGLDMTKYDADVNSAQVLARINADRAEAEKLGFTGTPSFVLDGEVFTPEENSVEAFSKKIDELLAKKQ